MYLPKFPSFFMYRLRQGIFWYYFEENVKRAPRVHEEEDTIHAVTISTEQESELSVPGNLL